MKNKKTKKCRTARVVKPRSSRKVKFKVYKSKSKEKGLGYNIQLRSSNGKIMFDAGGYNTRRAAVQTVDSLIEHIKAGEYEIDYGPQTTITASS